MSVNCLLAFAFMHLLSQDLSDNFFHLRPPHLSKKEKKIITDVESKLSLKEVVDTVGGHLAKPCTYLSRRAVNKPSDQLDNN